MSGQNEDAAGDACRVPRAKTETQMAVIRLLLRIVATLLLAAAVVLAVVDATRSIAADALVTTSLGETWEQAFPALLAEARSSIAGLGLPFAEGLFEGLLSLPVVAVLVILSLLFYIIGRKPTRRAGRLHHGA